MSECADLEFVIDSAATDNFCRRRDVFFNFKDVESTAALATGSAKILGMGDIHLTVGTGTGCKNLILKNVFYVPNMSRNLVSVRYLSAHGFNVYFYKDYASICNEDNSDFFRTPLKNKLDILSAGCKV